MDLELQQKVEILDTVKDLDKNDYIDICKLIKLTTLDYSMIDVNERGTYIDLDRLDKGLLNEIHSMVHTKLQRIKSE